MFSEEAIQKKRIAAIENGSGRVENFATRWAGHEPRAPRNCVQCGSEYTANNEKYCSRACFETSGNCGGYQENSSRCKRSEYQGFQMHSGSELEFAKLLDEHNIRWVKNSTTSFSFVDRSGKSRKYYPDFYLPDFDHWVEIKGRRYLREDDDLRLAAVGNIERIMHDDLRLPTICAK